MRVSPSQMDDESIETAIGKIQKQQWNRMKQEEDEKNTRVNEMDEEMNWAFKQMEWDRRRALFFFLYNKHIRTDCEDAIYNTIH